jgi:NADPH:quinone reductase-like Zn-dependent oxidoreductase
MRAIAAEEFGGYQNLKLADIPKPTMSDGRVLVRMTAAGVTPLDHTILSGSSSDSRRNRAKSRSRQFPFKIKSEKIDDLGVGL